MDNPIINKVSESLLTTIDLEAFYPKGVVAIFDLKDYLFMELILKEKDFREALKNLDWEIYRDKTVGITCSADAIIPMWANMLVATYLSGIAATIYYGSEKEVKQVLLLKKMQAINGEDYTDKRVVIKGCGEVEIPEAAYVEITARLRPYVKSIMYGEPCSTVPIYKKKL